jgi:hypothetical protein
MARSLSHTNASQKALRDENSRKDDLDETAITAIKDDLDETANQRASVRDRHGEKRKSYLSTFECLKLTKSLSFVSPAPPAVGASLLARNKECDERLAALMPVRLPGFFSGNSQSLHDAIKMPAIRSEEIVSSRYEDETEEVLRHKCCSKAFLYPELPWGAPPTWQTTGRAQSGKEFLMYWEFLTCFACFYVGIKVPYAIGIDAQKPDPHRIFQDCSLPGAAAGQSFVAVTFGIIELIIDCMFIVDLFINFVTARWEISTSTGREQWLLIDDLTTIRHYYMWRGVLPTFWLDLLGVIPWQYTDCVATENTDGKTTAFLKLLRLLRLLKLMRLYRIRRLIQSLSYRFPEAEFGIGCFQLLVALGMMAHWLGCAFYCVGYAEGGWLIECGLLNENLEPVSEDEALMEWVTSLYWAITTMTTM